MNDSTLHFNSQLLYQEMERRGIQLKIIPQTNLIHAQYEDHIEYIDDTDLSVMPSTFRHVLDDKWKTKKLLDGLGFSVIPGEHFNPEDIEKAFQYSKKIGFPVVIKPIHSTHGYSIRMNVYEQEFKDIFETLGRENHFQQKLLVETQIPGSEFRLTVTNNCFFGAVWRVPPKVVGDGVKTIQTLIDEVNNERTENRTDCLCRIWADHEALRYLSQKELTLDSIPKVGESIFLRSNSNVSTGGDCRDITDLVHPFFKDIALDILKKLPDLPYVGIDLLTQDISKKGSYFICELNPAPGISLHTHPSQGISRDLPKKLIDLIFPETEKL